MSTRSKRREARRQKIREQFDTKVDAIVRSRERARRPATVDGMQFVERVECIPEIDHMLGGPPQRRKVYLRSVLGDGTHPLPVRFTVHYAKDLRHRSLSFDRALDPFGDTLSELRFTWRQWAVRAGDTEVRWYTPELIGPGAGEAEGRAQYAARKAVAYIERVTMMADARHYGEWGMRQFLEAANEMKSAILEWSGEVDPERTRAEREVNTGALQPGGR